MTEDEASEGVDTVPGTVLLGDLLSRCNTLLGELNDFKAFIGEAEQGKISEDGIVSSIENVVDMRQFYAPVVTELRSLQKLSNADPTAEKTIHMLRSSNLPFYSAIWEAAKRSRGLVAFHKRFYWDIQPTEKIKGLAERRCALVDVVARDGDEWIKISCVTEQRLSFELAKARWEAADSSDEEIEMDGPVMNGTSNDQRIPNEDEVDRMDLVRMAKDLHRASHANRIHYRCPQIRFALTKVSDPAPKSLIPVLERIRSTGAIIDLGPQTLLSDSIDVLRAKIYPRLLPSPHPPLTDTLNIDCTMLLALVSDLSHAAKHPILPTYNAAIQRQIELETRQHLLPSRLWPAMADKELVCTEDAAKRMREIVDTIGMPAERVRTELLLDDGDSSRLIDVEGVGDIKDRSPETLRATFAKYSDYTVPAEFRLPIRIVPSSTASEITNAIQAGTLPAVAQLISEDLTDINRSVFMYGWLHGLTTVTSNRTVTKSIESAIEKEGRCEKGPEIWLREPARSLLGKEKVRRK